MKLHKYPRTFHAPWSEGLSSNDKVVRSMEHFHGKRVIVTEKMDGENTTIYKDYFHARSVDGKHHPSQSYMKQIAFGLSPYLDGKLRICGENLYAKHSIFYDELPSYFLAFSVWEDTKCLSWDKTKAILEALKLNITPILYDGVYDEALIKSLFTGKSLYGPEQEGYVIRLADSFDMSDFNTSVVKFVRKDHVQTSTHWKNQKLVHNLLLPTC